MPVTRPGTPVRNRRPAWFIAGGAAIVVVVIAGFLWFSRSQGSTTVSGVVPVGAVAPSVSQPATSGQTVSLDQFHGSKVVLYFYEGAG